MSVLKFTGPQPCGPPFPSDQREKSPVMSEQEILLPPQQPRRQDARDLQSRLYREIGLAAVEAALLPGSLDDDRVVPTVGLSNAPSSANKVVLPLPLAPTIDAKAPSPTSKLTLCT